eukprot:SAG11_NODE_11802_length_737_cov_1.396552_1_plen_210_part_10
MPSASPRTHWQAPRSPLEVCGSWSAVVMAVGPFLVSVAGAQDLSTVGHLNGGGTCRLGEYDHDGDLATACRQCPAGQFGTSSSALSRLSLTAGFGNLVADLDNGNPGVAGEVVSPGTYPDATPSTCAFAPCVAACECAEECTEMCTFGRPNTVSLPDVSPLEICHCAASTGRACSSQIFVQLLCCSNLAFNIAAAAPSGVSFDRIKQRTR